MAGRPPGRHPELGELHRAQPRAWSTRSRGQAARVAGACTRAGGEGGWAPSGQQFPNRGTELANPEGLLLE